MRPVKYAGSTSASDLNLWRCILRLWRCKSPCWHCMQRHSARSTPLYSVCTLVLSGLKVSHVPPQPQKHQVHLKRKCLYPSPLPIFTHLTSPTHTERFKSNSAKCENTLRMFLHLYPFHRSLAQTESDSVADPSSPLP